MNPGSIETYRDANLIKGYVADVDKYPQHLTHMVPARFAVAFSCYYPCIEGHYFIDSELIAHTCKTIIGSADCKILDHDQNFLDLGNLEKSIDHLASISIGDDEQAVFCNVCRWDLMGGPQEYHDLYTLEVFASVDAAKILWQQTLEALTEKKCKTTIFQCPAAPTGENISAKLLRRIKAWLS